jgi:hypothetical protein
MNQRFSTKIGGVSQEDRTIAWPQAAKIKWHNFIDKFSLDRPMENEG